MPVCWHGGGLWYGRRTSCQGSRPALCGAAPAAQRRPWRRFPGDSSAGAHLPGASACCPQRSTCSAAPAQPTAAGATPRHCRAAASPAPSSAVAVSGPVCCSRGLCVAGQLLLASSGHVQVMAGSTARLSGRAVTHHAAGGAALCSNQHWQGTGCSTAPAQQHTAAGMLKHTPLPHVVLRPGAMLQGPALCRQHPHTPPPTTPPRTTPPGSAACPVGPPLWPAPGTPRQPPG